MLLLACSVMATGKPVYATARPWKLSFEFCPLCHKQVITSALGKFRINLTIFSKFSKLLLSLHNSGNFEKCFANTHEIHGCLLNYPPAHAITCEYLSTPACELRIESSSLFQPISGELGCCFPAYKLFYPLQLMPPLSKILILKFPLSSLSSVSLHVSRSWPWFLLASDSYGRRFNDVYDDQF